MPDRDEKKRICVVVLGDFGRSPRMQYHSISLAKLNYNVDVIAYKGTDPSREVIEQDNINIHYLKEEPQAIYSTRFSRFFRYVMKTLFQTIYLLWALIHLSKFNCILIQNPPSIPTLPVCWLICWITGCPLIVDFHNYGYTILGLTAGKGSTIVKIAKWCERYFGHKADRSICVTKAMKDDLWENWNIRASVLYDCPPDIFRPINIEEKHKFFMKMSKTYSEFRARSGKKGEERSCFTRKVGNKYEMLPDRPALIVSSTSWTEDEDFSILLSALEGYEKAAEARKNIPNLVVAITGKGHMKSFYEKEIKSKNFTHIQIVTLWLKFEDYPIFLGCADLGVSLHSSSSGLDLPMKVVDMFGCCLPVCAVAFECIGELVKNGENGLVFSSSEQLNSQLQCLFNDFPQKKTDLYTFRENLLKSSNLKWEENWNHTVYPIFRELYL